jgi:hypothetical protein
MPQVTSNFQATPSIPAYELKQGQYGQITEWRGDTYVGQFVRQTTFGLVMLGQDGDGWSKQTLNNHRWTDCRVRVCQPGEVISITI